MSIHTNGNGRVLPAIHFLSSHAPLRAMIFRRSLEIQKLTHCNAAASRVHTQYQIYTVHRNSYIETSLTFTQHPQYEQAEKHTNSV